MYKGIPDKKTSYALYEAGEFGNQLRNWHNYNALCKSDFCGNVTMRYADKTNKWCAYNIARNDVCSLITQWVNEGADMYKVKFNESAPDDHLLIQGEIQELAGKKYILSYSTEKTNMRKAMEHPESLIGNEAIFLLQKYFSKESMRNLKRLFATYPLAIVEFSTYDHILGNVPENNTIFWEVRNY